jgi:hypothetical protein
MDGHQVSPRIVYYSAAIPALNLRQARQLLSLGKIAIHLTALPMLEIDGFEQPHPRNVQNSGL